MNKEIKNINWLFLVFSKQASSRLMRETHIRYATNERLQMYLVQIFCILNDAAQSLRERVGKCHSGE